MRTMPTDFLAYLRSGKATEGELSIEPGWFQLWPEGEIDSLNGSYEVHSFAPNHIGFGSNGGGELLAFDSQGRVVMIPFIGNGESEAVIVAASWAVFEAAIVSR